MTIMLQVCGPFKSSTSTWQARFEQIHNIEVWPEKHALIQDWKSKVAIVFVPIRDQREIYMSAFFQDIDQPAYDYYFHEDRSVITRTGASDLIAHYNKFSWEDYEHLQYTGVLAALGEDPLQPDERYRVSQSRTGKPTVILFDIKWNNDFETIQSCFQSVAPLRAVKENIVAVNSNIGNLKWYAKAYHEFKQIMSTHSTGGRT